MDGKSSDEDVVEVKASNALVPNLTISVEKDEGDDVDSPVVELSDEVKTESQEPVEDVTDNSVQFKVEGKSFLHTKIYENKALQDMGLTPEEARLRKENRAKRFQSPLLRDKVEPEETISKDIIEKVVAKVTEFNESADADAEIRLDAVHLRGLDDMSTEDIFSYFSDFFPSHIEWIDDTSCNVVWKDETSAVQAVLSMSKPNRPAQKGGNVEEDGEKVAEKSENGAEKKMQDDDELDLMDSDDESMETEGETDTNKPAKANVQGAIDVENFTNDLRRCKKAFVKETKKVLLKLRLATLKDKKTLGGAKRSNYYRKYGNPNYGNVRGILSRSFMRRFHGRVAKREYESYHTGNDDEMEESEETAETDDSVKKAGSKRMYSEPAWVEAKKRKKNEGSGSGSNSSGSEDEPMKEEEKQDLELINSSAKDLSDAVAARGESEDDDKGYIAEDTMMADRITKKIEEARRQQDSTEDSKPWGGSVWARLGRKPDRDKSIKVTVNNQQKSYGREEVGRKLPAALRNRLGTKR